MTAETALRINGALCRLWFCCEVYGNAPKAEDIALLKHVTIAQCQTAADVVEAINNAAVSDEKGMRKLYCTVDAGRLPGLLELAKTLT